MQMQLRRVANLATLLLVIFGNDVRAADYRDLKESLLVDFESPVKARKRYSISICSLILSSSN